MMLSFCLAFAVGASSARPRSAHAQWVGATQGRAVGGATRAAAPTMRNPVDDVLDFLSDMGGYNGFTEAELRDFAADETADELDKRLAARSLDSFGEKVPTDERVTNAFVLLLIAFPLVSLYVGATVVGVPSLFKFS